MFEEAGLPQGVFNLVTGPGAQVGNALVEDTRVNGISFTGSTEIGTELYANGARRLKKVQAEMGGKNAVIVLGDADMDKALGGIVQGAFGSTGQRCTATSRVIVEESVYDEFMDGLLQRTAGLRVGDGIDPENDVSPLCGPGQYEKVLEYIGVGTEEGASLAYGGRGLTGGEFDEGYYVEPTVFTGVSPEMRIAKEEIFGPVLTVFKARDLEEAIQISNNVEFGLSSSVYTGTSAAPSSTSTPSRPAWSTSTPRRWAARCTCPSAASSPRAWDSGSRALRPSTSLPKPSRSTSTTARQPGSRRASSDAGPTTPAPHSGAGGARQHHRSPYVRSRTALPALARPHDYSLADGGKSDAVTPRAAPPQQATEPSFLTPQVR